MCSLLALLPCNPAAESICVFTGDRFTWGGPDPRACAPHVQPPSFWTAPTNWPICSQQIQPLALPSPASAERSDWLRALEEKYLWQAVNGVILNAHWLTPSIQDPTYTGKGLMKSAAEWWSQPRKSLSSVRRLWQCSFSVCWLRGRCPNPRIRGQDRRQG